MKILIGITKHSYVAVETKISCLNHKSQNRDLLATYYLLFLEEKKVASKFSGWRAKKVASKFSRHLEKVDMVNIKKILILKCITISINRSMQTRFGLTLHDQ